MKTTKNLANLLIVALVSLFLTACGGDSDIKSGESLLTCDVPMVPDASGTSCVAPEPIQCPAPTVPDALNETCVVGVDPNAPIPVYFPAENEAVLYFNLGTDNPDDYVGYRLHTWNTDQCDAYAPPHDTSDWANGHEYAGVDPTYGAYYILNLKEGYTECGNFIVHIGTDDAGKALGSGDFQMPLQQDDPTYARMNFTFNGEPSVFEYPVVSLGKQPVKAADFAAHWIDTNTLVWNSDADIATVKLHYSASAGIEADENDMFNGSTLELGMVDLTEEQKAFAPKVNDWPAYQGNWSAEDAKSVLKSQLVVVGYNSDGETVAASNVQADKVLDYLYTMGDMDADEAQLGLNYDNGMIDVALWAPTAQNVVLKVFDADKAETGSYPMMEDTMTGIWSYSADLDMDRAFYQFEVTVYHPQSQMIETLLVTDPYSVSLSTNGEYSQFVNLEDSDLYPDGWMEQTIPTVSDVEDAVIYEAHIRDFSAMDQSVSEENRGKYLAFSEMDSAPVMHLKKLAESGLTHFHILPANDIASINEDPERIVDLTDTVADLCALKSDAPVCGIEDDNATLQSVLESYSPYTNDAANLVNVIREFDSFNWGYDPKHFNVPDGIYASDADGVARIKEMRAMIQSLHEVGLRVVLDVVYNHTNSAGLWDNSVFDKIVPGYYHSRDVVSGAVIQSTCCNDTALEHRMMDKFMVDSLLLWTEQYKYDGFRFDIMSHGSKQQMLAARDAVRAVDEDNYFYGEGWTRDDRGFEQANQFNMAGTEISTFNDRIREGIRTGEIFSNIDYEDGPFIKQDIVKLGMAGSLADYVLKSYNGVDATGSAYNPGMYAKDPADVINYISKHDNESLWDQLQFVLPFSMSMDERVRAQNVSHSIIMLSQGVPFLQLGGDFLRSKSLDRNTYDAGDWFNKVDYDFYTNNFNVGLPLDKGGRDDDTLVSLAANPMAQVGMSEISFASNVFNEFLQIRQSSKLFRLTTADDIINRVGFHNIGKRQTQGLIVMSIDDGTGFADLDPMHDAVVVVVNTSNMEHSHTVATASGFSLHTVQQNSVDGVVAGASFSEGEGEGTFTVPALSTAVFVKVQGEMQGEGLSAFATAGAPDVVPYGDTTVLIRGDMNGWGETDAMMYQGNGVYSVDIDLAAGEYYFKVASGDWSTVNLGAPNGDPVMLNTDLALVPGSNDNLKITITEETRYTFSIDATNTSAPILNVTYEEPFYGTTVFLRGDMNGWSEDNPFTYIGDGKYSLTTTIEAGDKYFKVASADWATVNMGAPADDTEVLEREEQLLVPGSNDNLHMVFADGEYTFIFDASNQQEPILTVYSAKMFGETTVYVKGSMNGWSENDAMTYIGNSTYTLTLSLEAQSYEFKVASQDWSTVNLGATSGDDADVYLDTAEALVQDSQSNFKIDISEAGDYLFTVTGPDPLNSTLTVTKVM
ncbi:alpha-1,6-glucosidase domain-containing protein [Thalassotalea sp. PS06]|uniref:alpha-1,6-glucosidase domain-containing protein n=1 Tax=Thalassotalea sp. PS06 TaxID=2594005 RepID=UPI00163DC89D|nr:alpha-1,6-glucosidase domain-containing protein [Thalassotalea sp. PS06]